jgi:glutamine synthetase
VQIGHDPRNDRSRSPEYADGGFEPISARDTLAKPCYDPRGLMDNMPIVGELVEAMNAMGWDVYSFDHEDANGQFETDFTYTDALGMADRLVFFRLMANEIARKHGGFASFMPKPSANRTGSGAHYNMSLADRETGRNLFDPANGEDPYGCGVTQMAYHFIAGVMKHAKAISAVIAPTVNSYKRLVRKGSMSGSTWAPVFVCYGNNNRTNMLRIPSQGGRVECRAADIACNPYLGAAMMLAAGLEGIREAMDPGIPIARTCTTTPISRCVKWTLSCCRRTLAKQLMPSKLTRCRARFLAMRCSTASSASSARNGPSITPTSPTGSCNAT